MLYLVDISRLIKGLHGLRCRIYMDKARGSLRRARSGLLGAGYCIRTETICANKSLTWTPRFANYPLMILTQLCASSWHFTSDHHPLAHLHSHSPSIRLAQTHLLRSLWLKLQLAEKSLQRTFILSKYQTTCSSVDYPTLHIFSLLT